MAGRTAPAGLRRLAAITAAIALATAGLTLVIPGQPAVAAPGVTEYREDFQNHDLSGNPVAINAYTGAAAALNSTYTADATWQGNHCNGWILSGNTTSAGTTDSCINNASNFGNVKAGATAIGMARGESETVARGNGAYAAWTAAGGVAGVMLKSQQVIPMVQGHYYSLKATLGVAIESGSTNNPPGSTCQVDQPLITLKVTDGVNSFALANDLNPCSSPGSRHKPTGSTYSWWVAPLASAALRWTGGPTAAIELSNTQSGGNGNDSVFDDAELVDVTPQLEKSFNPTTAGVGQTVDLVFTLTNTDEQGAKTGWSFTDNLSAGLSRADNYVGGTCANPSATGTSAVAITGDLPGGSASCTVIVHVVASTGGAITNGAANLSSVSGVLAPTGSVSLNVQNPTLRVGKALAGSRVAASDQFKVEIADGTTVVNDTTKSTTTGTDATIDPGTGDTGSYSSLVTKTYTVREVPVGTAAGRYRSSLTCVDANGVQAGLPTNEATASYDLTPVAGAAITCTFTNTPLTASMTFDKQIRPSTDLNGNGQYDVGDTINYSFVVTNTGQRVLSNVVVNDPLLGAVTCSPTSLAAGASATCTPVAGHVVTQVDMDAHSVANTATATAAEPGGLQLGPLTSAETVAVPGSIGLGMVASVKGSPSDVNGNGKVDAGDELVWEFVLTNNGSLSLSNPEVNDPRLIAAGVAVICEPGPIAPAGSVTCTSKPYRITQADMDASGLTLSNSASGSAVDPDGNSVTSNADSTTTTLTKQSSLSLTKSVTPVKVAAANAVVTYSFAVKNTGTLTVTDLKVTETKFTGTGTLAVPSCESTSVAPGVTVTCRVDYPVTQADVDAAKVDNTASVGGVDALAASVTSNSSSASFTADRAAAMSLHKEAAYADADGDGMASVGDTISYTFRLTNSGNVSTGGAQVSDPMLADAGIGVTCDSRQVKPGDTLECAADGSYPITQDDVEAGHVHNVATAKTADGTTSQPDSVDLSLTHVPGMTLEKSATLIDANHNGQTDLGDAIQYEFVVSDTGNLLLDTPVITDPLLNDAGIKITCPKGTLAPGEAVTCAADAPYPITVDELAAGSVTNTASATSQTIDGIVAGVSDTVKTDLGDLPLTGASLAAGLAGLALVAGGVGFVVARRRRNQLA